jgi:hypothetical protein
VLDALHLFEVTTLQGHAVQLTKHGYGRMLVRCLGANGLCEQNAQAEHTD